MSRPAKLGVGVVGLGVGEQHARAFHNHPACRVVAVCDLDAGKAGGMARSFPGCGVVPRFEDLLKNPSIDVVAIASFDDAHFEQVCAALDAGKHVFVEKPLCRTADEMVAVKAKWTASQGRLKLRSNLILRTAPLYVWLRKRLRSGALGEIYAFDGDYLYGRLHKITEGWRRDVPSYSVMEGGGVHLVDLLLWLTGERPVAVTASGNRICTRDTAFTEKDCVVSTLEFPSGLIARITANFGCVHPHHHIMRVFGTRATFLYDDCGPRLRTSRDPAVPAEPLALAPLPANKGDLVPAFVSAILEEGDDAAETQSFFDAISICIAADRAAASGCKERIEYV